MRMRGRLCLRLCFLCCALLLVLGALSSQAAPGRRQVGEAEFIQNVIDFYDRMGETELSAKLRKWLAEGKIGFGDLEYGANGEYDRELDTIVISKGVLEGLTGNAVQDFWKMLDIAQVLSHEFVHTGQNRMYWNSSEISNRAGLFGHFAESDAYYGSLDDIERWVDRLRALYDRAAGEALCKRAELALQLHETTKLWVVYNNSIKPFALENRANPHARYVRAEGMLQLARDDLAGLESQAAEYRTNIEAAEYLFETEKLIQAKKEEIRKLEEEYKAATDAVMENPWFQLRDNAALQRTMESGRDEIGKVVEQARAEGCFEPPGKPGDLQVSEVVLMGVRNARILGWEVHHAPVHMQLSGQFNEAYDAPCDPPKSFGPVPVETPMLLKGHILGTPPINTTWSLYNTNSSLVVVFEPRIGIGYGPGAHVLELSGQLENNDLSGEFEIRSPGRLSMVVGAASGSGPLTGSCFKQAFTATVDTETFLDGGEAFVGTPLEFGQQLEVGPGGYAMVSSPADGTAYIGPDSTVRLEREEQPYFLLQNGSVHVVSEEEYNRNTFPVRAGDYRITPLHTEYVCEYRDGRLLVRVFSGRVEVSGPDGTMASVDAGQELALPEGRPVPFDTATVQSPVAAGLPLDQVRQDHHVPEPHGVYPLALQGNVPANGWFLEDPGADAVIGPEPGGALAMSVPSENDFWQGRTDSPRLLHKASGDFDLEADLFLEGPGNHLSIAEFFLLSPGSAAGFLAKQAPADSYGANYLLLGGWLRLENLSKLPVMYRVHRESADAPDGFVRLRLMRREDVFSVYWSRDGLQWVLGSRQTLDLPDTIWAGLNCKRMAHDGLGPVSVHIRSLELATAERGSLASPEWDLATGEGLLTPLDSGWRLELPEGKAESMILQAGQGLEGDFDMVASYSVDPSALQASGLLWGIGVMDEPQRNNCYIVRGVHSGHGHRYAADLNVDGTWRGYVWDNLPDSQGFLRLRRLAGRMSAMYWAAGRWVEVKAWDALLASATVRPYFHAANNWETQAFSPLAVTMRLERLALGDEAGRDWAPAGENLFSPMAVPQGVSAPSGLRQEWFASPFPLGPISFGPDGSLYAISSSRDLGIMGRITGDGTSALFLESDAFKGINGKGFEFLGQDILLAVDYWPDGGSPLGGLFQVSLDGTFRQWQLAQNHGGLIDIIPDTGGGWLLSDFEADGLWRLPGENIPEVLLCNDPRMPGIGRIALDGRRRLVYALNWTGGWPFGEVPALYAIDAQGQATQLAVSPDATNYGGLAWADGSGIPEGVYYTETAQGRVMLIRPGGSPEPFVTGLDRPTELAAGPQGLAVSWGDGAILWLRP